MSTIFTVSANPAIDLFLDVPSIVMDEVLRATHVRRVWAGKGFNVSRTVRRLGHATHATGFVGGYAGMAIRAGLAEEGIPTDFVQVDGETRTNVMVVDAATGHHIKVNQPGAAVDRAAQAAFMARVTQLVQPGDFWVLSGSLSPGMPANFYATLIELIHAHGAFAALDSSGAALRTGCAAQPELVKPNLAEAHELTGNPVRSQEDALQAVNAFHAAGAQRVALSLGADGLILSDSRECWHVQPPQIVVRTAVGAGDALLGGVVWALAQGRPLREVACWGVGTGSTYAIADELPVDARPAIAALLDRLTSTQLKP